MVQNEEVSVQTQDAESISALAMPQLATSRIFGESKSCCMCAFFVLTIAIESV